MEGAPIILLIRNLETLKVQCKVKQIDIIEIDKTKFINPVRLLTKLITR